MTKARIRRVAFATATLVLATPAAAQPSPPDDVRAAIASARLGIGYAQMINLSATPDLSAATYRIDASDPTADLSVLRLPYQQKWTALSPETDVYWKLEAGWLQYKQDYPTGAGGNIGGKWSAYSIGAGVMARWRVGDGFTVEPALDAGLARLKNTASYTGVAEILAPSLDGLLFNWNADAWLITPSIALEWTAPLGPGQAKVRGHVARSWISSFDETDSVQHFNEATNIFSVRAEYLQPTDWRVMDRNLNAVGYVGYAGFFGANRDTLGFNAVAEVGAGVEWPLAVERPNAERLRLAGAYLFGSGVWGWTVGVRLQY